ncbi:MAG: hypothetical protein ABFS34_11660 [Gemmatimonadota bacterium]
MKKLVMTVAAAAALAVMGSALEGAGSPTFAATGECAGGAGPLCMSEFTCTSWSWELAWPLRISRTCASWTQRDYYWETIEETQGSGDDPALPPGEETPEEPTEDN